MRVADLRDVAISEARTFLRQYREIIFEAPFQFQVDLLFIMRAVGILTGLANTLDPNFDVWEKTVPYAERYMRGRPGQGGVWRKGIEQTAPRREQTVCSRNCNAATSPSKATWRPAPANC